MYKKNSFIVSCMTNIINSLIFRRCPSVMQETNDHFSLLSSTSRSRDGFFRDDKTSEQCTSMYQNLSSCKTKCQNDQCQENKKYIKFAYDITKDIMQNGLYTDKELQCVFKKHIEENKNTLNMV